MGNWVTTILLLWAIALNASAGVSHDSNLDWQTIETEHFRIHFHQNEEQLARRFIPLSEQTYQDVTGFIHWSPSGKTDVVLTDEYDVSNGYASVFPRNSIVILLAAPDEINSLEDHNGWLELVFRHEFLHIAHLDKVTGLPKGFQGVFGRHPFLFPNALQPRWLVEGLATYVETDQQKGIGRGQSSYFNMLMRMESLQNIKPVRRINQPIGSWPAGSIPYLYGVNFFNYVRDTYGEEKIKSLVDNYSDNLIPFRLNSNSNYVLHSQLPDQWDKFSRYLRDKFEVPVAKITKAGIREGRALTNDGYQAGPLGTFNGKIYFVDFNGKTHTTIKVSDAKSAATSILKVNRGARFDLAKQGILLTQPEVCHNARIYYDIYRAGLDGKGLTRLTECARYRHAVWSAAGKQILAVHNELGINSLHVLDDKAKLIEVLWRGNDKEQIGHMDWSEETGNLVASIWMKDKGWNLAGFNFQTKNWQLITNDEFIQAYPSFTANGKQLIYSSDEDGTYNIYRLDLISRKKSRLSNLIGGGFHPAVQSNQLAYIGYNPQGFDVYVMDDIKEDKLSRLKEPRVQAGQNKKKSAEKKQDKNDGVPARPYSALPSLLPTWWMPYLQIDDQRKEFGFTTTGSDVLNRHSYGLTLAYDTENSIATGNFNYLYDGLYPLINVGISRSTELSVDSNDNPLRVRAEDTMILGVAFPFLSFDRSVTVHTAVLKEVDKDVWTNGVAQLADTREDIAAMAIRFNSAKRYPLSISRSEGRDVRLIYEDSDAFGNSNRKGQVTVADWREFIHFGSSEHVLALRLVEAHGRNSPKPLRLGGIQDSDTLLSAIFSGEHSPLFGKRDYTLRGYDEGYAVLAGKNMRLFSAEYRFPLWRIEHGWMAPPFGFNQLHATAFYDVGGTWNTGSKPTDYYAGAGVEINADLDIFYNVRVNVAFGFASGLDDVLGEDKVYIRIGSQF